MARPVNPTCPDDRASLCVADRILSAASELFYREGIQSVGIQRLIDEAGVAKASLYAHYASKDDVVAAYLARKSAESRSQVAAAFAGLSTPEARLHALFDLGVAWTGGDDYRGCPFQNASSELAADGHPAKAVIAGHRAWLRSLFDAIARDAGANDADRLSGALQVIFDGAGARVLAERRPDALTDARWAAEQLLASARPTS